MGKLAGIGSYIYWGVEGTALAGEPSTDLQIPLNYIIDIVPPVPQYQEEVIRTPDSRVPKLIYTSVLKPGEGGIACFYTDPFLALTIFTNKTVSGTWAGGAASYGAITGDFTVNTDVDTIWVQYHIHDQAANPSMTSSEDKLLTGVLPVKYELIGEKGDKLLKEIIHVKALDFADNVQAMVAATAFHEDSFDVTAVYEVSTITCKTAASIGDGDYFYLYGATATFGQTPYYVWFDQQGAGQADPAPTGFTAIECDISAATTANDVSLIVKTAIHAKTEFGAVDGQPIVTVTGASYGNCTDIVDVDSTLTLATTTQGALAIDGGWASWDNTGLGDASGLRAVKDCKIWWNSAVIAGLDIESWHLVIDVPYETIQIASSIKHTIYWRTTQDWTLTVKGVITGKAQIDEVQQNWTSKNKYTQQVFIDDTASENKYYQATNVYLATREITPISPSGDVARTTLTYKMGDGAITFAGAYENLVDPDLYVTDGA